MKQLLTLCLALMSVTAMAQWPSLPYNPDENGDGLIGVVDLAALLAQYNTEFASAVVSEDGESAVVYMGELGYFECEYNCNQLPGFWTLTSAADLVPVYPDLHAGGNYDYTNTWVDKRDYDMTYSYFPFYVGHNQGSNRKISQTETQASTKKCYCSAKQLPRVEYTFCAGDDFQQCADLKVEDGWYPLHGITTISYYGNYKTQAFWRWAE